MALVSAPSLFVEIQSRIHLFPAPSDNNNKFKLHPLPFYQESNSVHAKLSCVDQNSMVCQRKGSCQRTRQPLFRLGTFEGARMFFACTDLLFRAQATRFNTPEEHYKRCSRRHACCCKKYHSPSLQRIKPLLKGSLVCVKSVQIHVQIVEMKAADSQ